MKQLFVFSKKNIYLFLIFVSILFVFSLNNRASHVDEGALADNAYFLQKIGYVKTDQLTGYLHTAGEQQFQYHKLFVAVGAGFIKIFGFSVYSFKSVSLVFFLIFFLFLKKYLEYLGEDCRIFPFVIGLLLLNATIFFYGFLFRPEIMVMSLGFISFYNLTVGMDKRENLNIILSGIFAGLAFLAHMNGVIFCFAGFGVLLYRRRMRELILFSVVAIGICLMYFWDIRSIADLKNLYLQYTTHPNVSAHGNFFKGLFSEHKRFFHSEKEISFSLFFFASLYFGFAYLKEKYRNLLVYLAILMIGLAVVTVERRAIYALVYYPYMAIVVGIVILNLKNQKKSVKRIFFVLLTGYITIHCFHDIRCIRNGMDLKQRNQEIAKFLKVKSLDTKVLAPESFVFNQIENYRVYGYLSFAFSSPRNSGDLVEYLKYAKNRGIKYVVIDKKRQPEFDYLILDKLTENTTVTNYSLIKKYDDFWVFENFANDKI